MGCGEWAGPLLRKKNHFYPQSDEPGCILTHISTGRKHGVTRNLGTWILWFNHKTKLTKQCKNYPKKFMVRPKKWAAIAPSHHRPPHMPLLMAVYFMAVLNPLIIHLRPVPVSLMVASLASRYVIRSGSTPSLVGLHVCVKIISGLCFEIISRTGKRVRRCPVS